MRRPLRGTPPILLAFVAIAWFGPALGTEVYTWTDASGTLHFSDSPPPSGTPDVIEVEEAYKPGTSGAYPDPAEAASALEAGAPAVAPDAGGPDEVPKTAAQARREQSARRRAERQQEQAETDRMCALHRQRLEQVEPARRVFYTNEAGESVRMEDDVRVGLIEESKAFLAANCD